MPKGVMIEFTWEMSGQFWRLWYLGWSPSQIAPVVGVSYPTLRRWMDWMRIPRGQRLGLRSARVAESACGL